MMTSVDLHVQCHQLIQHLTLLQTCTKRIFYFLPAGEYYKLCQFKFVVYDNSCELIVNVSALQGDAVFASVL